MIETFPSRKQVEANTNINECLLFSKDKSIKGNKYFGKVAITEISKFILLLKENNHIYEILPPNYPVKPYFDLEIEKEDFTFECMETLLNLFIKFIIDEFKSTFGIELTITDFMILNCCRLNKLSYHIIINKSIGFKNVNEHKTFIVYLNNRFNNPKIATKDYYLRN
jgi:hypothetical protein